MGELKRPLFICALRPDPFVLIFKQFSFLQRPPAFSVFLYTIVAWDEILLVKHRWSIVRFLDLLSAPDSRADCKGICY